MMKFQYCLIVILLCTSHFSIAQTRKSINTVKKTLVRNATINGHLYQDTNGNGTQDAMEPNLRNVDLLLNQSDGSFQIVSTDVFGDWIALTPSGNTVVKIDQNDLPPLSGRIQTEGKDPSQVTAVMSQNTSAGNDGFFYVGTVAGRLYHDKNGNGQQNTPEESGIANITIKITDLHGNSYVATTNATGDWAAKVGVGLAIIAIDSKDPDFLKGVVIQSQGINPANANVLLDQTTVTIHSGFYIQVDTDGDGLFDHVEVLNGTDPTNSCDPTNSVGYRGYVPSNSIWRMSDCDGDGITNGQEFSNNTDPYNPCSPMPPATYTAYDRTNKIWLEADCDNDGLTNAQEIAINTNPFLADTDGDGLNDRIEVLNLTNPLDSCSPVQAIGYTAYDATNFLWRSSDCDGDGIINGNEFINKTDPFNPCSPILESSYTGYNINNNIWFAADCDGDGLTNGEEVRIKTNPFLADTDGDGITDGLENLNGTDPLNPCSPTPASTNTSYVATNTIWGAADCDGDGLSNGQEIRINTNPFLADTDGDGINDGSEFSNGSNPLNPCSPVPSSK